MGELRTLLEASANLSKAQSEVLIQQCAKNIPKDISKIANQLGRSPKDLRKAIESLKQDNLPSNGPVRNPDVRIDSKGNVYPETPNGVGDNIGNLFDYLP